MPKAPLPIDDWLLAEGFESTWARHQARAVLEQAGLTRPGKTAMAAEKEVRARHALARYVLRTCGDPACEALARPALDGRVLVTGAPERCEICGGSNNRRAALTMATACRDASLRHLLIVGGTATNHAELRSLLAGSSVELRCVDGAERTPTKKDAAHDLEWAGLVVVWASTPLPHKVSVSYTQDRPAGLRMITVARRSISALCDAIAKAAAQGMGRN
ncbi:MAG: hypothetical protein HYX53_11280 [Chloroflexi bacterium]|nr:hypothetical protein [Chloroflexota bacterium]